jgi:hypothetical protein
MKNDQNFRECTTQLYRFTQEAMKPAYEIDKKVTTSIPEHPMISFDQNHVSM